MELYGIRQKKRQTMPLAGIFMAITAVGVYRSFCDEFSYPVNYREVYLAIFIFSLIFTLTGMLKSIPKNILFAGYTIAFFGFMLLRRDYLKGSLNILLNYVNIKKQEYLQSDEMTDVTSVLHGSRLGNSGKAAIIVIIGMIVLAMAICIFSLKSRVWSYIPAAVVVIMGMMYGKTPSVETFAMLVAGGAGIAFSITNRKMKNKAVGYAVISVIMAACMAVSVCVTDQTEEKIMSKNNQILRKQQQYEKIAKNIADNIVEQIQDMSYRGRLSNVSPVYTGKNMFKIVLDKKPVSKIYFKEFSADTYNNGKWTSEAEESGFYSYRLKSIFSYGYKSVKDMADKSSETKLINMRIQYDNKANQGDKKLALPYYSDVKNINTNKKSDNKNVTTVDNGIKLDDLERSITRKADDYNIKYYDVAYSEYNYLLNSDKSYVTDTKYSEYVRENYLGVPDDDKLKKFADEIELSEQLSLKCQEIESALQADTTYTKNPGRLPLMKDYLDYFLFENKKGYCEHYATASTILLRLKNIPARYAAGYMVFPSQFQKVVRKSAFGKNKVYYVAQVHDEDAHAWSEIYKEGVGWLPVDMTKTSAISKEYDDEEPPQVSFDTVPKSTKAADKAQHRAKNTAKPKKNKVKNDNGNVKKKKDNRKKSDNKTVKNKTKVKDKTESNIKKSQSEKTAAKNRTGLPLYVRLLLVFAVAFVLFVIYIFYGRQKMFYLLYKKKISRAENNSAKLFVARRFLALYMGCEGRKMERLSDDEYIKKLSEVCDIGNLREILEKAAFSAEDISESELLCCLYIMNEIASKIRAERSLHCLYFELNLLQNFIIEKTK